LQIEPLYDIVPRLTSVYDITQFCGGHINPNLRGMGHTGWGETGNPTHCIRFQWNEGKGRVEMRYKIYEADAQWRPTMEYNPLTKLWVLVPDSSYEIMSPDSTSALLGSLPTVVSQVEYSDALRTSVLNCGTSMEGLIQCKLISCPLDISYHRFHFHLTGWTQADTESWIDFFNDEGIFQLIPLAPWALSSLKAIPVPQEQAQLVLEPTVSASQVIPEPLVCGTVEAAAAWKSARTQLRNGSSGKHVTPGEILKGSFDRLLLILLH
jgi:hypothetical protein